MFSKLSAADDYHDFNILRTILVQIYAIFRLVHDIRFVILLNFYTFKHVYMNVEGKVRCEKSLKVIFKSNFS